MLLPHDTYGTHLDNAGNTTDTELEMQNFEAAGQTLCNIWNQLVVDGFETKAEYIKEEPPEDITGYTATAKFRSDHVFETQYMTVYLKCNDEECCSPFVTNVESYFPHRRLPPLIPIKRTHLGVEPIDKSELGSKVEFLPIGLRVAFGDKIVPADDMKKFGGEVPYDLFLPSVQDKLEKRVCKGCSKYHATQKSLTLHNKVCKSKKKRKRSAKRARTVDFLDEDDDEEQAEEPDLAVAEEDIIDDPEEGNVEEEDEDADEYLHPSNIVTNRPAFSVTFEGQFVEKILNLREWLKSPWVLESDCNNND